MTDPSPVAAHYDAFPFPHPRPDLGAASVSASDMPAGARIWIAGCGTTQAARWARAHPNCEIIGTDVSATTIGIAVDLARRHDLDNLRLEVGDLRRVGYQRSFDLVVSTGVIHHLEDPKDGLRAIAAALQPTGQAFLMVYRRSLRQELAELREAARRASNDATSPAARFAVAQHVVADRGDRLSVLLRRLARATPTVMADALINPIEHHYEDGDIVPLLAGTGLCFDGWHVGGSGHVEFFARPTPKE